jgi:para-nitrobenzyl esterase
MSPLARLAIPLACLALACAPRTSPDVAAAPPASDPASQRTLPGGDIAGFTDAHGGHAWLGIPFAMPPVGERRWRAPEPPEPWQGVQSRVAFGASCPQFGGMLSETTDTGVVGSEDCLYLNVYAPRFERGAVPAEGKRLPVMFWIHGGGNAVGAARTYDGGRLATEQNVVVVTTNYRLGALGWFRHPALATEARDARDASGNYGTLDLIRGLEWVRDNVAAFGGDPGNVTIFGESAGGLDVFTLLVAPGARGLFHRAISQSGGTDNVTPQRAEAYADAGGAPLSSREIVVRLLARDGRPDARARADALSPAETAALLRGVSAKELLESYRGGGNEMGGMYDAPMVFRDGAVLPGEDLARAIEAGNFHRVPVLLGTNRDEIKLFMALDPQNTFRLLWLLPILRDAERYDLTAEYPSKLWKVRGVDAPARAMVAAGHADVYAYRFDWDEQGRVLLVTDVSRLIGAAHGVEIPFVFDSFASGGPLSRLVGGAENPTRDALARAMRDYWAEFARTGKPGTGGGAHPEWTAWSNAEDAPKVMLLDAAAGGGVRMSDEELTRESVLGALEADARFEDSTDRCAFLRGMLAFGDLTPDDYARRGCGDAPLEDVGAR